MSKKTCPKTLRYSVRANIPADEDFKKDIQSVKEKAEQGFLRALTRFHYRRLNNQKIKINKENTKVRRTCKTDSFKKTSKARRTLPTAETDIVKLREFSADLQNKQDCIIKMIDNCRILRKIKKM